MLYALDTDGKKVRPTEEIGVVKDAYSGYPVTSRGKDNISIWKAQEAPCDSWSLPQTKWGLDWKLQFPRAMVEEVLTDEDGNKHIADVFTGDGTVIKFQHRVLSIQDMRKREKFFRTMIWILNASSWDMTLTSGATHYCDIHGEHLKLPPAENFEWTSYTSTYSKVIYQSCKCSVFLDFGDDKLHWINWQGTSGLHVQLNAGIGLLKTVSKQRLLDRFIPTNNTIQ